MSKRHQTSRRRTYGRRQHELHERPDHQTDALSWLDDAPLEASAERWTSRAREAGEGWLRVGELD